MLHAIALALVLVLDQATPRPVPPTVPAPMSGSGSIDVRVVADGTGRPVKGARVVAIVIADEATFTKITITDARGRALLLGLAAGRVRIAASHPGFLGVQYGETVAGGQGTFMPLERNQHLEGIVLRMHRPGAIGGRCWTKAASR